MCCVWGVCVCVGVCVKSYYYLFCSAQDTGSPLQHSVIAMAKNAG